MCTYNKNIDILLSQNVYFFNCFTFRTNIHRPGYTWSRSRSCSTSYSTCNNVYNMQRTLTCVINWICVDSLKLNHYVINHDSVQLNLIDGMLSILMIIVCDLMSNIYIVTLNITLIHLELSHFVLSRLIFSQQIKRPLRLSCLRGLRSSKARDRVALLHKWWGLHGYLRYSVSTNMKWPPPKEQKIQITQSIK